jgi:hypothetical protein
MEGKENYTDVPAARVRMFRSLQLRELTNEGECGARAGWARSLSMLSPAHTCNNSTHSRSLLWQSSPHSSRQATARTGRIRLGGHLTSIKNSELDSSKGAQALTPG